MLSAYFSFLRQKAGSLKKKKKKKKTLIVDVHKL